ncbi:UNVERIFIED_CONTAM: protein dehydration-induced [Sesamum radiatum]|uniref:Protein dehydration-induced n=1 Tax=Sesamum radiatum TaxID=300843 RepID=A0AAW2RWU2_SESRA
MDANSWAARLSSASKRYQTALQSRSGFVELLIYVEFLKVRFKFGVRDFERMKWDSFDAEMLMGFEEIDVDDDIREEYPCPFCTDYFDIVGLCCHIDDEHPVEARNGLHRNCWKCLTAASFNVQS